MHIYTIANIVIDRALVIFDTMGYKHDFCVQSAGGVVVFGGTNRLIFDPKLGYYPDKGSCTPQFLAAYDRHYGTDEPEPEPKRESITLDQLVDKINAHLKAGGVVLDYYRNDPPNYITGVRSNFDGVRLKCLDDNIDGTFLLRKSDYHLTPTAVVYDVGHIVFLSVVNPA
jgi:hypothetical protein